MNAYVYTVCHAGDFELTWRMPLTKYAFYFLESLKQKGFKGIERPVDYKEMLKLIKEKLGR